jgi:hypothetical protein
MIKIIYELTLSYGWAGPYITLEKEMPDLFLPEHGMEIKFPEKTCIGTISARTHVTGEGEEGKDTTPRWDMDKNIIKIYLGDVSEEDNENYLKKLDGLREDGWKITGADDSIKRKFKIKL